MIHKGHLIFHIFIFWLLCKSSQTFITLNQKTNIHAFIPVKCNDELEGKLSIGNIFRITNFDVEHYKPDDKFRCVLNDNWLQFSEETKVKLLKENDDKFTQDYFDFYDHTDLKSIAGINVYLTGNMYFLCLSNTNETTSFCQSSKILLRTFYQL